MQNTLTSNGRDDRGGAGGLLSRLEGVRRAGEGRWMARCPAHADRSPSLSIRELPDGRVLIHCFGGCATEAVVAACGMRLADLMPPARLGHRLPSERRAFGGLNPVDVLVASANDALIAATVAAGVARNRDATDNEVGLLYTIAGRLARAVEVTRGR